MIELAKRLGLIAYVEHGRIKTEGFLAETKRLWAVSGADILLRGEGPTTKTWDCYMGGSHAGCILTDTRTGYTYSFTGLAGS